MAMFVCTLTQCRHKEKAVTAPSSTPNAELIGQLGSDNPEVVIAAAKKTIELGPKAEDAIPILLERLGKTSTSLDMYIGDALVAIGDKAGRAMIASNDKNVIDAYSLVLSKFDNVAELIGYEMLKSDDSDKVHNLLLTLTIMGKKAAPAMPSIEKMRSWAANNPAREAMLDFIEDAINGGSDVRQARKQAAQNMRPDKATILRDFRKTVDELIVLNFTLNPPTTVTIMGKWAKMEDAMEDIGRLMTSESSDDRVVACATFWNYGKKDAKNIPSALAEVKHLCSDEKEVVRLVASYVAMKLGDKTDYSPRYIQALSDYDDVLGVIVSFAGLLELKTVVEDEDCLTALIACLSSKTKEISTSAALVLINSGMPNLVQSHAEKLLSSPVANDRLAGVAMLVKIGDKAQSSLPILRRMSALETMPEIKTFVGLAIESIGENQSIADETLGDLDDSSGMSQTSALLRMKDMSSADKRKSVPRLLEMVNGGGDIAGLALSTLCSFGADAEAASDDLVRLLKKAIAEKDDDSQFVIAGALGEIGKPEFAPLLFTVLRDGTSHPALSADLALQKLGPEAKAITKDLLGLTKVLNRRDTALGLVEAIGKVEEADLKTVAAFLGEKDGMASYHAINIIVAQGTKVGIPIFQEAIFDANKDRRLAGLTGMMLLGRKEPAVIATALEKIGLKVTDKGLKTEIVEIIKDLREKMKK